MQYQVSVNDETETPQVSRVITDKSLFEAWWAKAELFAMNRGLYACGMSRENENDEWKVLVEFES